MHTRTTEDGYTLIELLVGIGLIGIVFGGIYMSYSAILDSVTNAGTRADAVSILNRQMEIIRNLPYDSVGVAGGIPNGIISSTQTVSSGKIPFTVLTTVRNIDDPFDGTVGGNPNDTAPADYKLVEVQVSCGVCPRFIPLAMTSTVAPKNLESSGNNGSLFVTTFDANGVPIPGSTVHVTNNSVVPAIDLTDVTNANGVLQLVGVPMSAQAYHIDVSKSGYSSDRTYPQGGQGNPNPVKPDATVATGTVTQVSFAIDKVAQINLHTSNNVCAALPGKSITISGTKLIGTNPNVVKYSTTTVTDTNGARTLSNIEWDNYSIVLNDALSDVVGTIPFVPIALLPAQVQDIRFVLQPAAPDSLLVTVKDASGAAVNGATVVISKGAFSATQITGRNSLTQTDWSGGKLDSQTGMDANIVPGSLRMAGPPYSTSSVAWLISQTFDVGSSTASYYSLQWSPVGQPAQTTTQFQIASNNDNATWNFVGPDGTANTYFTVSGDYVGAFHDNHEYIRYKVYFSTLDENSTPNIDSVGLDFTSACVPSGEVLFNNLSSGTYSIQVSAPGFQQATSSISVAGGWQEADVTVSP